jgi:hypothetical protein
MERDIVAGFSHYAAQAPEALDYLTPKERHRLYKMLRLKVLMAKSGDLEVEMVGAPVEGSEESSTAGSRRVCPHGRRIVERVRLADLLARAREGLAWAWLLGPLSPVQEGGAADQVHDAGASLYASREGELLAALAPEGVASLRVPIVLAPEQDQPLAAPAFQDDPFRSLDLPGTLHVNIPLSLAR